MAFNSLMSARSDFSSLGSSLSSIQQNALDDQIANNASLQNYNNANLQVQLAIPSSFGEIAFGGYELLGQGKNLVGRLLKVKNDIIAAPQKVKDALIKGGNKLGESFEEAKSVVTGGVSELKGVASSAASQAADITNRVVSVGSNVAEEIKNTVGDLGDQVKLHIAESTSNLDKNVLPGGIDDIFHPDYNLNQRLAEVLPKAPSVESVALPKFTLPATTKRPTTLGLADTSIPENIRQQSLRMVEPEQTEIAASTYLKPFEEISTAYKQLTPAKTAITSTISTLQNEAGGVLTNVLGAGKGAQQGVATTLASATEKGGALASDVVSAGSNIASKAVSTVSEVGAGLGDVAKAATSTLAETGAEVASAFLPVVGEVTAIGLGAMQVYEGFKDLFSHPSAAKPVSVPLPSVANIAQGFQSGI